MKYGCVYHNREQFVFEEQVVSYRAGLWATVGGVTVGLLLSVALTLVNRSAAIMLFLSVVGYLVSRILKIALKSDPIGASIFVLSMGSSLVILFYLQDTVSRLWGGDSWHLMLFYTTVFGVLAPLAYLYAQVAFIEDKRKHQLLLVTSPSDARSKAAVPSPDMSQGFGTFANWIKIIILDFFSSTFASLPASVSSSGFRMFPPLLERRPDDSISGGVQVHNQTLKRLKVCLYHPSDYCCWIPIGGIGGPAVAFISAGETITVYPPFPEVTKFKLKVFSPSLIDRELCFEPRTQRGDSVVVKDVQQRIIKTDPSSNVRKFHIPEPNNQPPSRNSSSTSLRRNVSFGSSSQQLSFRGGEFEPVSFSPTSTGPDGEKSPSAVAEDEIFICNASSASVTLTFYPEDAVSFMFPLGHRDIHGERNLPKETSRKFLVRRAPDSVRLLFCMRASQGNHELDFCTVQCGHSYAVTDGLID